MRVFTRLGRGLRAVWLAIAHVLGSAARGIGRSARSIEPEHRRDGFGLLMVGVAVVAAAAVWWGLPGDVMEFTRTVLAGTVGKVGWFVPILLVYVGWRNMRDPQHNGPVGRQAIGWAAFGFGALGIVHIANGSPAPVRGDASDLQDAGGAIGYVVSSLLLDLLRTSYVVVPLLTLLAFFGVLIITATPVYQIPTRLRETRAKLLGIKQGDTEDGELPTQPVRARGRRGALEDTIDPATGFPPYDTPVLEDREVEKRRRSRQARPPRVSRRPRRRRRRGPAPTRWRPRTRRRRALSRRHMLPCRSGSSS